MPILERFEKMLQLSTHDVADFDTGFFKHMCLVLMSTWSAIPPEPGYDWDFTTYTGELYDGVYSGVNMVPFLVNKDPNDPHTTNMGNEITQLQDLIRAANERYSGDAGIVGMFYFPSDFPLSEKTKGLILLKLF